MRTQGRVAAQGADGREPQAARGVTVEDLMTYCATATATAIATAPLRLTALLASALRPGGLSLAGRRARTSARNPQQPQPQRSHSPRWGPALAVIGRQCTIVGRQNWTGAGPLDLQSKLNDFSSSRLLGSVIILPILIIHSPSRSPSLSLRFPPPPFYPPVSLFPKQPSPAT